MTNKPLRALGALGSGVLRAAMVMALALGLAGCASGPGRNPRDPIEPFNREVTKFNDGIDAVLLKPVATLYRQAVPPLLRTGVSNFFGNLGDAWSTVNNLLQFKIQFAAESLMRFSVNSTIGMGGLLDVASDMNLERHREDFGQTLGRWGVPAGPYVVLPLLGPSTLRDAIALPVDYRGNPVYSVQPDGLSNTLVGLRLVDTRANLLRAGEVLEGAALDKYSFTRDAYLQRRRAETTDVQNSNDGSDAPAGPATSAPESPAAR